MSRYFTSKEQINEVIDTTTPMFYDYLLACRANDTDLAAQLFSAFIDARRSIEATLPKDAQGIYNDITLLKVINYVVRPTAESMIREVGKGHVTSEYAAKHYSKKHYYFPEEGQGHLDILPVGE